MIALELVFSTLWEIAAAAFEAAPVAWLSLIAATAALGVCVHELLERRGPSATLWGMGFAGCFALWLVLAPDAGAAP